MFNNKDLIKKRFNNLLSIKTFIKSSSIQSMSIWCFKYYWNNFHSLKTNTSIFEILISSLIFKYGWFATEVVATEELLGSFRTSMTELFARIAQQMFNGTLIISLGQSYEKPPKVNKIDLKSVDHILKIEVSSMNFPVRFKKYLSWKLWETFRKVSAVVWFAFSSIYIISSI